MARRNLPPRKVCAGCGGWFYGYAAACARCRNEQQPDSSALVDVIRERRIKETVTDASRRVLGYGELPDGF